MAVRARLTPPKEARQQWDYHGVKSASLSASMLFGGDRRMEAGTFLADGFSTRLKIQARHNGWLPLVDFAEAWQPNRLKGIQVSSDFGTPFLAATQVYDLRPIPRKWLSLDRTDSASRRFVKSGAILVTCSGTVGRATLARSSLQGVLISHDLLRVEPRDQSYWGWLYAYLRAPSIIALMQAAHYGHVIKHLEVSHLNAIPVVDVDETMREHFNENVALILAHRNRADALTDQAEKLLSEAFDLASDDDNAEVFSSVSSSEIFSDRRRLEGAFHAASARTLLKKLGRKATRFDVLSDIVERVWWMTRFSRRFGDDGVPYRSADELFSIDQVTEKRVYLDSIPNHKDFFVREGWILMACSGQIYGLNGSVTLATKFDEGFFFSHDLIRISPQVDSIQSGYLYAYLGHPALGQILVKRTAYGSSVPHIDPSDVESIPIARLDEKLEGQIADLAEEASRLRSEASSIERKISLEVDEIVQDFISEM